MIFAAGKNEPSCEPQDHLQKLLLLDT